MALTRRIQKAKPEAIKPLPPRDAEPETTLCVDPVPEKVNLYREKCSEPCIYNAYRDGLCYHHMKLSQGFVFDDKQKRYVKKEKK